MHFMNCYWKDKYHCNLNDHFGKQKLSFEISFGKSLFENKPWNNIKLNSMKIPAKQNLNALIILTGYCYKPIFNAYRLE